MMEPGLAREFNQATKIPIQVVNRIVNDPTATPYEDVLQTYLKSVLIGDETAERIRDAFDAYVFLSYRKKDRAHAQRLMRLIHQNDDFRDIAIWYDEYLIPGEEYNEDIKLAFAKSTLFAMAVTPSLEEKGNYVMRVEYPMARDREKEEDGFQIVPVEMYDHDNPKWRVDQSHLREFRYQNIEKLQDEHRETEMNQAFLDALENMARKKNDGSARHRFFIGLAYLCGIDVEIDPARALAMISDAATDANPCMEATEKLVDMYLMGDGVPVSISSAVSWQETLCEQLKAEVNKNHSADEHLGFGTRYFRALLRLSDLQRETGNIPDAMARAEEALHVAEGLTDEVGKREVTRDTAVICTRIGSLLQTQGDYNDAKRYFARAEQTYASLARELGTTRARRDLSIAKERLGDAERKEGDTSSALQHYLAVLQIREELASGSDSLRAKRDLSVILTKLGTCYRDMKEAAEARRTFERAYEIDSKLAAEEQSALAWDDLTVSLVKLGDMEKEDKNLTSAAAYYQKAYDQTVSILSMSPDVKVIVGLSTTAIKGAAQAVADQESKALVTGIGLPSALEQYIGNDLACPYMFMWSPYTLGKVTAYATIGLATGKITGEIGEQFRIGAEEVYQVTEAPDEATEVIVDYPRHYNSGNIADLADDA